MSDSTQSSDHQGAAPDSNRNPIDVLADSFLNRLRQGEYPAISEYTTKYPKLADEIRSVFPALAMLEKGGEGLGAEPTPSAVTPCPQQIGEYQILREVGRGGMGVVYEARHETMRRRVALKLLPAAFAADDVPLQRFYLEARVAGRLHHTNIVPVFEVGTDGDYHYYAMQFIQGQNLDVVFKELRRAQGVTPGTTYSPSETSREDEVDFAKSVAISLASGHFQRPVTGPDDPLFQRRPDELSDCEATIASRTSGNFQEDGSLRTATSQRSDAMPRDVVAASVRQKQPREVSHSVTSDLNDSTQSRDDYFRRVAKIGLQIADALSYAHGQGILHRDIKPSNIILDAAGTAWITDFGLAKDDDGDLTGSGDILGTIRYMAPERFEGHADARSDVYGLGLTLYELCTLRSAFPESDRARLVREVCNTEPTQPRKVNPQTPRDLETIILKAIEKRPSSRYQAARHVATDLRLFLADLPIRARRISAGERTWRWCRRNPQQAVLAACVLLLLSIVSVGSVAFGLFAANQAKKLSESEGIAIERLYESLRKSAEASRWSGRIGQHFASLKDVASAVEILPQLGRNSAQKERELVKLRNAAIAAMPLPDVLPVKSWDPGPSSSLRVTFNPTYSTYAHVDHQGSISLRSTTDDTEYHRLPAPTAGTSVLQMQFNPNGRFLAVKYGGRGGQLLRVWDATNGEAVVAPDLKLDNTASFDFDATNAWIAVGNGRTLTLFGLADGKSIQELPLAQVSRGVRVSPSTGQIAVLLLGRRSIQIWNPDTWEPQQYAFEPTIYAFAWHPQNDRLAVGGHDGSLRLVRLSQPVRETGRFEGHTSRIHRLHFSPSGDQLVSQAWDGTIRLWKSDTGQQLLRMEGLNLLESGFSGPDGRRLGMHDSSRFHIWEVARETPLRILRSPASTARRWSVDIDPSGRWLASARNDGVEVWDVHTAQRVSFLPARLSEDGRSKDAKFLPDGSGLLTSNNEGVRLFPLDSNDESHGPPDFLTPRTLHQSQAAWVSLNGSGNLAAFRHNMGDSRGVVMNLAQPSSMVKIGPHPGIDHVTISPNGRWVATATWSGSGGIHVWDAQTGERISRQALESNESKTNVIFSPDSARLAASTSQHHVAWDVETLEPIYRVPRNAHDEWPGPLAYSPDGRLLVAAHSRFVLALLDANSGKEIGVLDSPSDTGFHACCFNPDGTILAAASDTNIHLWDLAKVRKQLASINLDF